MRMPPPLRKAVLTAHVATSVGWFGALLGYVALDIITATVSGIATVRSAYVAMDVIVRYAIVPLAIASVLIGIVNALGTSWGLFRHYWVLVKLILTLVAAGVLLHEAATVAWLADLATSTPDPGRLSSTLPHSIGGLIVLSLTLVLSVFKPRGLTRHGWRKQRQELAAASTRTTISYKR